MKITFAILDINGEAQIHNLVNFYLLEKIKLAT